MKKKYPPISGLRSSSDNLDMTPTTKTEKKKSFLFFKESERESKTESKKSKKEEAAAIQAPAFEAPTIDPLPPLPEGAP
jgi:hypothetical protein